MYKSYLTTYIGIYREGERGYKPRRRCQGRSSAIAADEWEGRERERDDCGLVRWKCFGSLFLKK